MQKNVLGFYALLFCEYSKEMASLHGFHSNVNRNLKYISNAGGNSTAKALSNSVSYKQVLPSPLHFESFSKFCWRNVTAFLSSAYGLSLSRSQLVNTLSICSLSSFYFYYHLSLSLIHRHFISPDSTIFFQFHYGKFHFYFHSPQHDDTRMTFKK